MQRIPFRAAAIAAAVTAVVAACGGSSSDDSPPTPPAPTVLSVTGTAATGAALANAAVTAKCATGTGAATSGADGTYTISITSGALPCVLEAAGTDSHGAAVTLHSVATTSTAQITPLTELLVAQVTGAAPSAIMGSTSIAGFSATFSASNVQAAQAKVVAMLTAAGIDTSSVASADLFAGTLTVGSSTGYDHVLEYLGAALTAGGTSLATLTDTVVAQAAGDAPPNAVDATSALSSELLLRPAAPTCSALRSGEYWGASTAAAGDAGDGGGGIHLHVVDAQAGTIRQVSDGTLYTLTPVGGDSCHFTIVDDEGGTGDVVVSSAGVFVARGNASRLVIVGIPRQSHTLDEMAGNWNWVGMDTWDDTGASWVYDWAQLTITNGAAGATLQAQRGCVQDSPTVAESCFATPVASHTLAAAADGGFFNSPATTADGAWTDKLFAYHAGNGEWFALSSACNGAATGTCANGTGDGSIGFASRTRMLSLPAIASVSDSWNIYVDTQTQLSSQTNDTSHTTVTGVDSTAGSFTRTAGPIGGPTHPETLHVNDPYAGFNLRDLATGVTASDGSSLTVRQAVYMKTGVGLSVIMQPITTASARGRLLLSVGQPAN